VPPLTKILKGAAFDFFFPQKCIGCGKEGSLICANCLKKLPRISQPICPKCGRHQPSGILCPACINWKNNIDGIRSPFRFEGTIRESIHQLKYKNLRDISNILSHQLFIYLTKYPLDFDIIVPVPLHPRRLKERGYNQSSLLAVKLGKLIDVPVYDSNLLRIKYTIPQVKTAGLKERQTQISDAFLCKDKSLNSLNILLLDDVSTSGATLDACAKALKSAGTAKVWGLSLARDI